MYSQRNDIIGALKANGYEYKFYLDHEASIDYMFLYNYFFSPVSFLSRVPHSLIKLKDDNYAVFLTVMTEDKTLMDRIKKPNELDFYKLTGHIRYTDLFNFIYLTTLELYTTTFLLDKNSERSRIIMNRICPDSPDLILEEGAIEHAFTRKY